MWKTALATFIIVLVTMCVTGAGYAYYLYQTASEQVNERNQEYIETIGAAEHPSDLTGTISFLLLGMNDNGSEQGTVDAIIAASVNPKEESVLFFSIPQPARVPIPGHGMNTISHAYSLGGAALIKETTEKKLDHSFDYVIESDMKGLTKMVEEFGGVKVTNDFPFSQENVNHTKTFHFKQGTLSLNGEKALAYIRMRKSDPDGEAGRNERQREVLASLLQQSRSRKHLLESREILSIFKEHVKVNITLKELEVLFKRYRSAAGDIRAFELEGSSREGTRHYQIPEEEWQKASLRLEEHQ